MSILVRPRLPLPDPQVIGNTSPELVVYLTRLNNELQNFNLDLRKTLKANMKTGTLVIDDGANWRLTVTLQQGRVSDITTATSSGAALTWTEG